MMTDILCRILSQIGVGLGSGVTLLDTSRAEFRPVKLRVISGFPLSIFCITLLAGAVGEILLPTNSRQHNPTHSLVVSSGFLPTYHQHAQLFIPIRLDSLTLASPVL